MKIAIYSANFGNYRNEISNIYNKQLVFNSNIDYYFFTDTVIEKSHNWKIILIDLKEELSFMDKYRHTAKYIKWIVPDILDSYDIIIWVDTKSIYYINIKIKKIIELINKDIDDIYFIKHNDRTQAIDELNKTIETNQENENNAKNFKKLIDMKFNSELPDTKCMIYKNNEINKNILKEVYDLLITHGLKRDQNVVQYAFFKHDAEKNIKFLNILLFKKNINNIKEIIKLKNRKQRIKLNNKKQRIKLNNKKQRIKPKNKKQRIKPNNKKQRIKPKNNYKLILYQSFV